MRCFDGESDKAKRREAELVASNEKEQMCSDDTIRLTGMLILSAQDFEDTVNKYL